MQQTLAMRGFTGGDCVPPARAAVASGLAGARAPARARRRRPPARGHTVPRRLVRFFPAVPT
ncbi:hypothetical protein, partial [Burkholderia pseudomallei]|uniref:hypothetical protein n=1 Tax=Burkholderia pseudomallei TaxID=28450 RepID=UPI0007180634